MALICSCKVPVAEAWISTHANLDVATYKQLYLKVFCSDSVCACAAALLLVAIPAVSIRTKWVR